MLESGMHELTRAFQQTVAIGHVGPVKEPDIDVIREGIDVGECRITDTRSRMTIMQQFLHIVSVVAQDLKPALRDRPQFI
jgi:hypothetical protein